MPLRRAPKHQQSETRSMKIIFIISTAYWISLSGCASLFRDWPYSQNLQSWGSVTKVDITCFVSDHRDSSNKRVLEPLYSKTDVQVSITDEVMLRAITTAIDGAPNSWRTYGPTTLPIGNGLITLTRSDGKTKHFRSFSDLKTISDLDGWRKLSQDERVELKKYFGMCVG
jgi:hypothetical protein